MCVGLFVYFFSYMCMFMFMFMVCSCCMGKSSLLVLHPCSLFPQAYSARHCFSFTQPETHSWINGKSDLSMERSVHTFTDDCLSPLSHPSTIIAFIGITGSYQGDIVWASRTVSTPHCCYLWPHCAFMTLCFFLWATLKTSAQLLVAQPVLIIFRVY